MNASVDVSIVEELEILAEAAQLIGLEDELRRITARKHRLGAPTTLVVAGLPRSGKSALIDVLLGKTFATKVPQGPWVTEYAATSELEDYAWIQYSDGGKPRRYSVEKAKAHLAAQKELISQVVWYVSGTTLPAHVLLREVVLRPPYEPAVEQLGVADAVLLTLPVDRIPVLYPLLEALEAWEHSGITILGVLNNMQQVPEEHWSELLRRVRIRTRGILEQIIPLESIPVSPIQQPRGLMALQRVVHTQLFVPQRHIRGEADARFVQHMRKRLVQTLERSIDTHILAYGRFVHTVHEIQERLAKEEEAALQDGLALIDQLKMQAQEMARALETGQRMPIRVVDEARVVQFFNALEARLGQFSEQHLQGFRATLQALPVGRSVEHVSAIQQIEKILPPAPVELFRVLLHPQDKQSPVEVSHFEGKEQATTSAPIEVAIWQKGTDWVEQVGNQIKGALTRWLRTVRQMAEKVLVQRVRLIFQQVIGVLPEHVERRVLQLEQVYERLRGSLKRVPAPHLFGEEGMSPAVFLLRAQDPEFVQEWNTSWTDYCWRQTYESIRKWTKKQLIDIQEELREEWQQKREEVHRFVIECWKKQGIRALMKGETVWSFQEVLEHTLGWRNRIHRWLSLPRFSLHGGRYAFSMLYLHEHGEYFLKAEENYLQQHTNHQLTRAVRTRWQRHIRQLRRQDFRIRLKLSVRRWIWGGSLGLTTLVGGMLVLGASPGMFLILMALLLCGIAVGVWVLPEFLETRGLKVLARQQAEKLHHLIGKVMQDVLAQFERWVLREIQSETFEDEVLAELHPVHQIEHVHLSYRDLTRRLAYLD